jgi:hypothetical protein
VVEFLSESWVAALDAAARAAPSLAALGVPDPFVVEQRVRQGDGEVVYHLSFQARGARVLMGPAAAPDLVLFTDADTARALQQGTLGAQDAAARRRLTIRGQAGRLRNAGEALRSLEDVFRTVRDQTTYPAENGDAEGHR